MEVKTLIDRCGFETVGCMEASKLVPHQAVRDACAEDKCGKYDKCWACPPRCGTLDEYVAQIGERSTCYLLQTVMELEDAFDIETIYEAQDVMRKRLRRLQRAIHDEGIDAMMLAVGGCELCETCTCPDEPCRHPDLILPSMEAIGIVVSEACVACGIPYNHGPNTISFTGAVLV